MQSLRKLAQTNVLQAGVRAFHPTSPARSDSWARFKYNLEGYNKYGLLYHDIYENLNPEVHEAVRRMPEEAQMARLHRSIKASQLEVQHTILPKEEWTKFEDDHYYLQPYLDEVRAEKREREEWDANH